MHVGATVFSNQEFQVAIVHTLSGVVSVNNAFYPYDFEEFKYFFQIIVNQIINWSIIHDSQQHTAYL